MPNYIVTYDLKETTPAPHWQFITAAESNGWAVYKWGPNQEKWYRLPNTTLVGEFPSRADAKSAFNATKQATERALGIAVTVEKYILAAYSDCTFDSDEKLEPQRG